METLTQIGQMLGTYGVSAVIVINKWKLRTKK